MTDQPQSIVWLRLAWPGLVTWCFSTVVLATLHPRSQEGLLPATFFLIVLCLAYTYVSLREKVAWPIRLIAAAVNLTAVLPTFLVIAGKA